MSVHRAFSVRREEGSKWYVTEEEFAEDRYPTYCAGWAYVTSVHTMRVMLKAAEDWAAEDPYIKSGAYASVMVKPFKKVLP